MNSFIIDMNLDKSALNEIGGKGRGLFSLARCGAKIPATVCITPESEPSAELKKILEYFSDTEAKKQYAVRSSGSLEDGKVKSFAGQFESYLRISGSDSLIEAIDKCRKSGQSERIKKYNFSEGVPVSVLIQEMVEADFSGVLFTCNPVSGSVNHITLEMVRGTSEDLLGGTEWGERYVTDRNGEIIEGPEGKEKFITLLKKLVLQALEVEENLKDFDISGPLDFEWAVKDGEIIWLQVRPVTVFGKIQGEDEEIVFIKPGEMPEVKEGEIFWTSMNAQEALPGAVSPLSEDIMLSMLNPAFLKLFNLLGVDTNKVESPELLKVYKRRAFLDVTSQTELFSMLPIKNPEAVVEKLLTGTSAERPKLRFSLSFLWPVIKLLWKDFTLRFNYEKFNKKEMKAWTYPEQELLEKLDDVKLWQVVEDSMEFQEGFTLHAVGTMRYAGRFSLLEDICKKYDVSPGPLIQGLGTLRFASSSAALRDVTSSLKKVKDKLFDENYNLIKEWKERLEEEQDLKDFHKVFYNYINDYGHIGNGSVDMSMKNWREEPERVLKLAVNLLKKGEDLNREGYLKKLSDKREEAVKKINRKLSIFDRIKFPFVLRQMQSAAPYRENLKFLACRRMAIAKDYLKELALRFVRKNIISSPDDIFFLKRNEVKEILTEKKVPSITSLIQKRKKEFQEVSLLPYPLHIVKKQNSICLYFASVDKDRKEFLGTPGSAGTATGRARVIGNLSEASRLEPGEILVAMNTDPSWTPLFSIAKAIVVEVGSIMSHGAVVAREEGIPAVLGLPGIVGLVRDGDTLFVDGTRGKVVIQSGSGEVENEE